MTAWAVNGTILLESVIAFRAVELPSLNLFSTAGAGKRSFIIQKYGTTVAYHRLLGVEVSTYRAPS